MTVDYTKVSEQKAPKPSTAAGLTASVTTHEKPRPHELEERICNLCYWIGRPRIIEQGSWLGFILPMLFDTPEKLYGCRGCNHPNSMVTLDSHEGKQALYWHEKKKNPGSSPTQF